MTHRMLLDPEIGAALPFRETVGRYFAIGCLSVLVDTGILVGLRSGLGSPLWVSTVSGLSAAFLVNFTLNFTWVFRAQSKVLSRATRYLTLVAANFLATVTLVLGLTSLGANFILAKFTAVAACATANFVLYRNWVFR